MREKTKTIFIGKGKRIMAKDGKAPMSSIKWVIGIAAALFALMAGVYSVGWNVRGQTAHIKAVEVKTDNLKSNFDKHRAVQAKQTEKTNKALGELDSNMKVQSMLLEKIEEKLP